MREIDASAITRTVRDLCIQANRELLGEKAEINV